MLTTLSIPSVIAALLITAHQCLATLIISKSISISLATIWSRCFSKPKTELLPSIAISLPYFCVISCINFVVLSLFHISF